MVLRPRPLWIALGRAFVLAGFYFLFRLLNWRCPRCNRPFFRQEPPPREFPRQPSPTFADERCFNRGSLRR
jgi:hypothetical protein